MPNAVDTAPDRLPRPRISFIQLSLHFRNLRESPACMGLNLRLMRHVLALVVLVALADICLLFALLVKPFSESIAWRIGCWTA